VRRATLEGDRKAAVAVLEEARHPLGDDFPEQGARPVTRRLVGERHLDLAARTDQRRARALAAVERDGELGAEAGEASGHFWKAPWARWRRMRGAAASEDGSADPCPACPCSVRMTDSKRSRPPGMPGFVDGPGVRE
jgi:hypothetical protein